MKKIIALASILTAAAFSAQAEMISLESPMQAASLHEGGVDMVVHYLDEEDHFQLVANYLDGTDPTTPNTIRMALTDGDRSSFNLPGVAHVIYSFERVGSSVIATADPITQQVASN